MTQLVTASPCARHVSGLASLFLQAMYSRLTCAQKGSIKW